MQTLPLDDPGRPDTRSPGRFLLWTAAKQWPTQVLGLVSGMVWMVSIALVPAAVGKGIDDGIVAGDGSGLLRWSLALLGLGAVAAVTGALRHLLAVRNWLLASYRSAQLAERGVGDAGPALTRAIPTGDVVAVFANDVMRIGGLYDVSGRLAGAVVSYVVVGAILLSASPALGWLVLLGGPVLLASLSLVVRPLQRRQAQQREEAGRLTTLGADTVAGLRVLRGIGGEKAFFHRYRDRSQEVRQAGVRVALPQSTLDAAQVFVPGLFVVLVTWLSARFALSGKIDVGDLVAFYGYAAFLVLPLRTAAEAVDKITRSFVGAQRMLGILAVERDISEPEHPGEEPPERVPLKDLGSGLAVEPGKLVGLVSAMPDEAARIADRLGRFRDDDGVVLGDVRLADLPIESVRRRIVVSEADPVLFSGSLRSELDPWGRVDGQDEKIHEAIAVANAEDVIETLPEGLDAYVDERGRSFSGGQRQRLVLARALLSDAETLVLVEPTSAVDAHTEARIARRLREARGGKTTVVVTASPLMLDQTDHVFFVDNGRVVAEGTHRELLRTTPAYKWTVTRGEDV
jgi:ABC-type multidrug transport system fused ATPase/permease subunit